jgi:hypothetical protein
MPLRRIGNEAKQSHHSSRCPFPLHDSDTGVCNIARHQLVLVFLLLARWLNNQTGISGSLESLIESGACLSCPGSHGGIKTQALLVPPKLMEAVWRTSERSTLQGLGLLASLGEFLTSDGTRALASFQPVIFRYHLDLRPGRLCSLDGKGLRRNLGDVSRAMPTRSDFATLNYLLLYDASLVRFDITCQECVGVMYTRTVCGYFFESTSSEAPKSFPLEMLGPKSGLSRRLYLTCFES